MLLRTLAPVLALAGLALAPAPAALAQAAGDSIATLQANGDGEVMVVPDIAIVTIGVVTRAATAGDAIARNSTDLDAVIAAIRAEGVEEKDIATTGFNVNPVYQTQPRPPADVPPPIVGYSVSNDVRVTIRAIASSGPILDKVVRTGANRVSGIQFDVSDRAVHEDAAIARAIAEARRRGTLMAEAAGVTLGRVLSVTASAGGGNVPVFARFDAASAAPPVLPGQRAITASASVTWEIGAR
jgi:uncharacterized protein YggE